MPRIWDGPGRPKGSLMEDLVDMEVNEKMRVSGPYSKICNARSAMSRCMKQNPRRIYTSSMVSEETLLITREK